MVTNPIWQGFFPLKCMSFQHLQPLCPPGTKVVHYYVRTQILLTCITYIRFSRKKKKVNLREEHSQHTYRKKIPQYCKHSCFHSCFILTCRHKPKCTCARYIRRYTKFLILLISEGKFISDFYFFISYVYEYSLHSLFWKTFALLMKMIFWYIMFKIMHQFLKVSWSRVKLPGPQNTKLSTLLLLFTPHQFCSWSWACVWGWTQCLLLYLP